MTNKFVVLWKVILPACKYDGHERFANLQNLVRRRNCRQEFGLADTQFAVLQLGLKMCGDMANQPDVADRQHQCQQNNSHVSG